MKVCVVHTGQHLEVCVYLCDVYLGQRVTLCCVFGTV